MQESTKAGWVGPGVGLGTKVRKKEKEKEHHHVRWGYYNLSSLRSKPHLHSFLFSLLPHQPADLLLNCHHVPCIC